MPDQETIKEFIIAAHSDLPKVQSMLADDPTLIRESYDWNPGGREDALQAAGHVGNRPIAEYVLGVGLPMTVFAAAMLGIHDDVRDYLEDNPALATTPGVHGIPLMWHAALSGDPRITALVAECGAPVDSSNLHAAISKGHAEMVRWLLDHGATDLSVKNFQGQTVIEAAEAEGNQKIIEMLRAAS